ncbi:zinc ABC transporter substrate-binding protein [Marinomonas dokdonensis]|uniref:zinc ABC transporter substrate-binding protein n=1 Tax=Marinomonas dokdonensis TaxID=328224 RepID=UPI00405599A9
MKKLFLGVGVCTIAPFALAKPVVVTSVTPVSMIVAAITGDKADIEQIVSNTASPHDYALRPSDLRKISQADAVVWVGESLENFLEKPLINANKAEDSIEWLALEGTVQRRYGEENEHHDEHGHDDHDHDEHHDDHDHDEHHDDHDHDEHHDDHDHDEHHDDHDHDEHHDDHDHDEHHDEHGHDEHHDDHDHDEHHDEHGHEGHDHTGVDPHVWLSPVNAKVLAQAVAQRLVKIDSANAEYYETNLSSFLQKLDQQDSQLAAKLSKVKQVPYIVFHDAYRYFEEHYGLNHAGEVTVSPERKPGAKKIAELRHEIEENNVQCVFSEPQFSPAIVKTLLSGSDVKTAQLDPLGSSVDIAPQAYLEFLEGLGDQFLSCLG